MTYNYQDSSSGTSRFMHIRRCNDRHLLKHAFGILSTETEGGRCVEIASLGTMTVVWVADALAIAI